MADVEQEITDLAGRATGRLAPGRRFTGARKIIACLSGWTTVLTTISTAFLNAHAGSGVTNLPGHTPRVDTAVVVSGAGIADRPTLIVVGIKSLAEGIDHLTTDAPRTVGPAEGPSG